MPDPVVFDTLDDQGENAIGIGPTAIAAEDTWTARFVPKGGRPFAFSIRGTFTATVSIQHSMDDGAAWFDLEQYIAPTEGVAQRAFAGEQFRIGVAAGDYVSGTVSVEVRQ